jgi:ATP-dependent DNA helicase RecG
MKNLAVKISLKTELESIFRLGDAQKQSLRKLGLKTVADVLYHFPARYTDTASLKNIRDLAPGEQASVYGTISNIKLGKGFRSRVAMATATITDETGAMETVWFHQPYIAKMIPPGASAKFSGRISQRKNGTLYISNPEYEFVDKVRTVGSSLFAAEKKDDFETAGALFPVYPETRGVTSRWLYHAVEKIFNTGGFLDNLTDPIPPEILEKYHLPGLKTALIWIHAPRREDDARAARKRFAFEEVFFIQLAKQSERVAAEREPAFVIEQSPAKTEALDNFSARFPFKETGAQKKAIAAILDDFASGRPMSRLLEGDVGSGKTAVAAATAYVVASTRPKEKTERQNFGTLQVAYMCPTEILANQHFESFIRYFFHLGTPIALITSSGCKKFPSKVNPHGWTDISRPQLLKWVAGGEIPILIGTHSLIQKAVAFKHLAYVIIDEQHRFGIGQRQKLARKEKYLPHLLSMTATPIPRTLALTIFGDLDLTLLDEMPPGRKPIITEIVKPTKRADTYEKVRRELAGGRQAYVICPRIDEPDPNKEMALEAKSVKTEAKRLKKDIFPEYEVGIIHGKMSSTEKEKIMAEFSGGRINILVATSLIEVGVNVPNATVILIEGAERFGLAQLHQLRGRVIRSNHQAYCYVFTDSGSQKTLDRLKALVSAKNGFELAEADLQLRGAGELYGGKQWGLSDVAMEALKNQAMVEAARTEARLLVEKDPDLAAHPMLKAASAARATDIHFE